MQLKAKLPHVELDHQVSRVIETLKRLQKENEKLKAKAKMLEEKI